MLFLLFGAVLFVNYSLRFYLSKKAAFVFSLVFGLYYPMFRSLPFLLTECLSVFLISGMLYFLIRITLNKGVFWMNFLVTALFLAYLALTKVVFGYVLLVSLFFATACMIMPRYRSMAFRFAQLMLLALFLCGPYLAYTYQLTGKAFYWSNSGSMSLYTMSTPFAHEYGEWRSHDMLLENPNHTIFVDSLAGLDPLSRDAAFRQKAIENIRAHPEKYLINWISNLGRLFLSYPFSYAEQNPKAFFTILPNLFMLPALFLSLVLFIVYFKRYPPVFGLLLGFFAVYLGGSSLISAYNRMFYITMPFWILLLGYSVDRFMHLHSLFVSAKEENNASQG